MCTVRARLDVPTGARAGSAGAGTGLWWTDRGDCGPSDDREETGAGLRWPIWKKELEPPNESAEGESNEDTPVGPPKTGRVASPRWSLVTDGRRSLETLDAASAAAAVAASACTMDARLARVFGVGAFCAAAAAAAGDVDLRLRDDDDPESTEPRRERAAGDTEPRRRDEAETGTAAVGAGAGGGEARALDPSVDSDDMGEAKAVVAGGVRRGGDGGGSGGAFADCLARFAFVGRPASLLRRLPPPPPVIVVAVVVEEAGAAAEEGSSSVDMEALLSAG